MKYALLAKLVALAILFIIVGAGSCNSDLSVYVLKNYGSVRGQMLEIGDNSFAVLDKPEEGRLLVAQTFPDVPVGQYRLAADTFLKRSGRRCTITKSESVTLRQFEYHYACT